VLEDDEQVSPIMYM